MHLQGEVAVITGGNNGIGLATAEELKARGAKLALFGRDDAAHRQSGRRTLTAGLDSSDRRREDDRLYLIVSVDNEFYRPSTQCSL